MLHVIAPKLKGRVVESPRHQYSSQSDDHLDVETCRYSIPNEQRLWLQRPTE